MTIQELREAISQFNDNDIVVVEIHEGVRHEDLYEFTIDEIQGLMLLSGEKVSEIRFTI
jgi:hypothetical protein